MSTEQVYVPVIVTCDGTPIMSLSLANHRDVAAITVSGELDLDTAPLLIDLVERVAAAHPDRVIIDMANVTFICAAGITALMRAHNMITGAGGRLVLPRCVPANPANTGHQRGRPPLPAGPDHGVARY